MDQTPDDPFDGRFGRVTLEADDLPPVAGPDGRPVVGVKYVFRPSPAVANHLPADFQFSLRCVVLPDGLRRFYPSSFERHMATGFAGGLAILAEAFHLSPHQRHSYRAMYQLFGRLRQTRERLQNRLLNASSLRVPRVARDAADERSILPADLGLDARGQGEPWALSRLLREGREAALAAGMTRPDEEACVHYGFVAAAERNPLYITDEESLSLVRIALYESIFPDGKLEPDLTERVVERTLAAVRGHLAEPSAAFDAWFAGPKNSFVNQIARRKLLRGGVLGRDPVRRALQELGWQSYRYVADCLDALMRLFGRLLPEPLTEEEKAAFAEMNLNRPYLGNLPLALLVERFPFLQAVLWEIWRRPGGREPIAVLHRLLSYYAEMAPSRRASDRVFKKRRPAATRPGDRTPLTVPLPTAPEAGEGPDKPSAGEEDDREREDDQDDPEDAEDAVAHSSGGGGAAQQLFDRLAELLRERRRIRCGCAVPVWDAKVVPSDGVATMISHACTRCGFTAETTASLKELQDLAKELL